MWRHGAARLTALCAQPFNWVSTYDIQFVRIIFTCFPTRIGRGLVLRLFPGGGGGPEFGAGSSEGGGGG